MLVIDQDPDASLMACVRPGPFLKYWAYDHTGIDRMIWQKLRKRGLYMENEEVPRFPDNVPFLNWSWHAQVLRDNLDAPRITVGIYFIDRRYGGPEEGSWWYDQACPSAEHYEFNREFDKMHEAGAYARDLQKLVDLTENKNRRELGSVLSDGRYRVLIKRGWPKRDPEERPHYE